MGCSRKKARNIHKGDQRNGKTVAKSYETGSYKHQKQLKKKKIKNISLSIYIFKSQVNTFNGGLNIQTSSEMHGIIGNDPDRSSSHSSKSANYVFRVIGHDFKDVSFIDDLSYDCDHIIRLIWIIWNQISIKKYIEKLFITIHSICSSTLS